jgi:hypothetical protein
MHRKLALLGLAALLVGTVGQAGEAGQKTGAQLPTFSTADTDQNGLISRVEADKFQPLKEMFTKVDANQDGSLSPSEYDQAKTEKIG